MKIVFSESDREQEKIRQRMDRFDAIVCEYCRHNKKSVEELSETLGCGMASLWRYRTRVESFRKMPLHILAGCFRLSNVSNRDLRFILGLPTGMAEDLTDGD